MEETTDVGASDSPEATPGSALHRFGKARRKLARELRGPRRLARLYSQGAQSETELNDAGDCRTLRGAARLHVFFTVRVSKKTCPPPVF